jgi:predicted lipoprotein with Yx(FWY)xxD motif
MRHRHTAAAFLFALASAALGQVTHIPQSPLNGESIGDFFGASVSGVGDVNGDGFADFIVGASDEDTNNGFGSGSARVFSGIDGSILYTFNGDSAFDGLGESVSGAGDINNDGISDFIVGAPGDDNNGSGSGSARVFSGADGSILYTFNGDSALDRFGRSVSGAGDVNNDGFDDLIVGAVGDNNGLGSARVFSGADGSILYTFNGAAPGFLRFGTSVSGAGDVNNDGFDDVIIGATDSDTINGFLTGSAGVFSGANGSILYTFNGDAEGDQFGISVSGAGDVNNDGFDDVIVGATQEFSGGPGSARVFSGADGSSLYTFNGDSIGDFFGTSVSGTGDVNNDGVADLIVGAPFDGNNGAESGSARVFSGVNGSILYTFNGDSADDRFGLSVSGAGDVNNDGVADLIVGAPFDDNNGAESGSAFVFVSQTTSNPCQGDANGDNLVNFSDLNAVLAAFGQSGDGLIGDVNGDGVVNFSDLNEVLANFGNTCP